MTAENIWCCNAFCLCFQLTKRINEGNDSTALVVHCVLFMFTSSFRMVGEKKKERKRGKPLSIFWAVREEPENINKTQ